MRTLTLLLSLSLLAVAAVGCTTPSESNDDPTSGAQGFLEACEADAACADGLTCERGVCTRACELNVECEDADSRAICLPGEAEGAASTCQPQPNVCPDYSRPLCEEGERLVTRYDDDNCPYPACSSGEDCPIVDYGAPFCEDNEQIVTDYDADGCPFPVCRVVDCPAPAPFPGECAEGFDIGEVLDANGCPRLDCVPVLCPPVSPPECEEGQEILIDYNERGCAFGYCSPTDCPVINIPLCPDGQEVQQTTGADGCPRLDCVSTDCPPVAAPPADSCPDGQIVVQIEGPNGCPDWACAPVSCPPVSEPQCEEGQEILFAYDESGCAFPYCSPRECPPVAAPAADSCPPGQRVIEITREDGCGAFDCTAEGCEDTDTPELCFDGQPPHRRGLTPNGCTVLTCDAERSFDCGPDRACSFDTEYCSVVVPGVEGASTSYSCSALPDTCLDAPSCGCLAEAGAWPENAGSCEDGGGPPGSATLTVTLFAP